MNKNERAEFEAWARSKNYNTSIFDDGTYIFTDIQVMAECWLAARRTQSEQVRELVAAVERLNINDPDFTEVDSLAAQLKETTDEAI